MSAKQFFFKGTAALLVELMMRGSCVSADHSSTWKALSGMKAYYGATFLKWNGAFFISSSRVLTASTGRARLPLLRQHTEGVLHEGVILKYMFECNLISLCSANTTSLVANNNTWRITSIINRYSNHSDENSAEERGWGKSLVCWLGARNRMWLDDKNTNHDLSFCFVFSPFFLFSLFFLILSEAIPLCSGRTFSKEVLGSPSVVVFLAHPV